MLGPRGATQDRGLHRYCAPGSESDPGAVRRSNTQIFPPSGPDRRDSFFAEIVPADQVPGRLYLGITSPGRNPKVLMRRVWLALMGAAERAYRDAGGRRSDNPADPYMTVLGYFNSLRELGGARRILEEEVQNTIKSYSQRKTDQRVVCGGIVSRPQHLL